MARELQTSFFVDDVSAIRVVRFHAAHEAGRPSVLEVEVVLGGYVEIDAVLGHTARLSFGAAGDEPRSVFGIVESATVIGSGQMGSEDRGTRYVLHVVSQLALLGGSHDSQIFQDMTVKEIVAKVLADHGVEKVDWRLTGSYPKRENTVQYQESALAFISRILEHEGIYSSVEADPDKGERLVFADDSTVAAPIPGDPELPLKPRGSPIEARDAVYALHEKRTVCSGKFVLRDFDFTRPSLDMTGTAEGAARTDLEVYDYPGGYIEPSEGQRLAKVRLEEEQMFARTIEVDAICARLAVGAKIKLADAADLDGEYVAFAVSHTYDHQGAGGLPHYVAHARLVPADVKIRPARVTPVPVIEGPQTATVVAPEGSPGETIHTDKHGRAKVKFHWDRTDILDERASCWLRVSQLQTSGSMMLPRIGWEVVVEFLEGDPDRPIISGRVYNGVLMPPYALPEGKTRTAIKTASTPGGGGQNEIRFEDKAGAEEIMLHAQYDMKVTVANNAKKKVGNNETTVVKNNASLAVGSNQTTKVTKGSSNTIGADQTVSVGGNRSVEVNAVAALTAHGGATTSVGGNQFEMDGNPLEAILALAAQTAANFAAAMADNAVAAVQAHVDGAVNQVMAPINNLNSKVEGVSNAMQQVAGRDLSGVGGMVAGASGIPGAAQFASSLGGGGGSASRAAPGGGGDGGGGGGGEEAAPPAQSALATVAMTAAHGAINRGMAGAQHALAGALGLDSGGGGGESGANAAGPVGDVPGIDATDREKGPGHSMAKVTGSHTENVGSLKVRGALQSIDTNVTGSKSINVGAATVQLAIGNYAELVGGAKKEKAVGLIVLSKGGESEEVGGSKSSMVGGAVVDKLKGSHAVQAGGPATFIGAFHKVDAKGAIVFKCGESEVTIDGGGVTVSAPLVTVLSPKIQLPKKVAEV